ncbi:MAG TPA: flagellar biosynthetic protein FliR [Methylomirabilota bacterium]|nr:flagellar biosynthetic protein FliR [Methylomirabilota bacterium]
MTIAVLPETVALFLLLFARIGALVMLLPALGERQIPTNVRLAFALSLSAVFYPFTVAALPAGVTSDMARLLTTLVGEILVGASFGLLTRILIAATQVAGAAIAANIGLGFVQTVDPTMGQQGAIIGSFLGVTGMTLIFVTNLHHLAIAGVADSYAMFPPGEMLPLDDLKDAAVMIVAETFKVGIQLAAPFIVFALVFNLGLGVLAKLMPQLQVFFIAMPVSIGVGLLIFSLLVSTMMGWYLGHLEAGFMRLIAG